MQHTRSKRIEISVFNVLARPSTGFGGLAVSVFAMIMVLTAVSALGQPAYTPAGTVILNQAGADYEHPTTTARSFSNVVLNPVLPIYQIQLTPFGTVASPAYSLSGSNGDTLYCDFQLENLGNAHDSVAVSYRLVPPTTMTPSSVVFFNDGNGNGVFDPGEDDPSYLGFDAGLTTTLDVAVILPLSAAIGEAFIEVGAVSTGDTLSTLHTSVFRVNHTGSGSGGLHAGPANNPQALPGGEGSSDDRSVGRPGYGDYAYAFTNDVLNELLADDFVELSIDSLTLPAGVSVALEDTLGVSLPPSPLRTTSFMLGSIPAGQVRRVRTVVTSTLAPLSVVMSAPLDIHLQATSMLDSSRVNRTLDRLVLPVAVNPSAALAIKQTFRQSSATAGDIVTLVVDVTNITDSLRVDDVVVSEVIHPQLNFMNSLGFALANGYLTWNAGSLDAGESRSTVVKFVANSRVASSWARATGRVTGTALTGEGVSAGPVVSSIKIENDLFASEGVIIGEVFVDDDGDGVRDPGEAGQERAVVYLESGEYVVTDSLGMFAFPRVFPGYRMVRLDESTLEQDVHFEPPLDADVNGPRANERLVHLLPGGNARVSFVVRRNPIPIEEVMYKVSVQEKVSIHKHARLYKAFSLPSSYFGFGRAELSSEAGNAMRQIASFLRDHPDWNVFLEGHTDNVPIHTERFPDNQALSLARAEAVRSLLIAEAVSPERIVQRGYGEVRPIATNETIEGRRLNRRVDVSFMPPGVGIDGERIRLVDTSVGSLGAMPDSFRVKIFWELSTTSEKPIQTSLRVQIPGRFKSPDLEVTAGGSVLSASGGEFEIARFARSQPIQCVLTFECEEPDTAFVKDIRAELNFLGRISESKVGFVNGHGRAPSHRPMVGTSTDMRGRTVVLQPFAGGPSTGHTQVHDVLTWAERVSPPKLVRGTSGPLPRYQPSDTAVAGPVEIVTPQPDELFSSRDQIAVHARVPLGSSTQLSVGGVQVDPVHIGQRTIDVKRGEELITWYGVAIVPGWNEVLVSSTGLDGTIYADTVAVALSSRPAVFKPVRDRIRIPADGRSTESVSFHLQDELFLPVMDGIVATVEVGAHLVSAADARPTDHGLQVLSKDGFISLPIKPRTEPGSELIVVSCSGMEEEIEVVFVPPERSMLATGIVDLKVGSYKTSGNGDPSGIPNFVNGFDADAEARLFVQGTAIHGLNLTARLDSRDRFEDPLLKDLSPDRQYPIYGDGSSYHHAAPSQGGNYVSLERGESFVRYGDFRTPIDQGEFLNYQRAATGFTSLFVRDGKSITSFVTRTDLSTHRDEIPADGTSGFYYLGRQPIVENSERVLVETRDRYQSEKILRVAPMIRDKDYTINPFDGSILFKAPVAAFDRSFNPVHIVVTYETENHDNNKYLYGVRGAIVANRRYRLGTTAVANSGDGHIWTLLGADGEVAIGDYRFSGEVARSEDDMAPSGNAYKVRGEYRNDDGQLGIYLRRVDGGFTNPSFRGSQSELSSVKSGLDGTYKLSSLLSVKADGYIHELDRTEERRENFRTSVNLQHRFLRLMAGVRVAGHNRPDDEQDGVLALLGAGVGGEGAGNVTTQWEKNVGTGQVDDYPDRLKTQAGMPLGARFRLLASHEYLTASGRAATNQITAGVEGDVTSSMRAYSRYSMDRAAADARMGAVSGIRQNFRLSNQMSATAGIESFQSLAGREDEEYFSFKSGINVRVPGSYFLESQYENRVQTSRVKHMVRVNAAQQFNSGVSWLTKNVLGFAGHDNQDDELSYYGTLATAYRPIGVPVQLLAMMRNYYERFTPVDPAAITWRFVLSADVNYRPVPDHETRFKYAFKHVEDYSLGMSLTTNSDLVLGQYIYHFARAWDVDAWGRWQGQRGGGWDQTGAGIELGRLFFRTVRVGAGYSINGFEDPDITNTDAWSRGFGVRLQLILSERLFGGLERLR